MAKNYGERNAALHAKMGTVKGRKSVFRSVERINKPEKGIRHHFGEAVPKHWEKSMKGKG